MTEASFSQRCLVGLCSERHATAETNASAPGLTVPVPPAAWLCSLGRAWGHHVCVLCSRGGDGQEARRPISDPRVGHWRPRDTCTSHFPSQHSDLASLCPRGGHTWFPVPPRPPLSASWRWAKATGTGAHWNVCQAAAQREHGQSQVPALPRRPAHPMTSVAPSKGSLLASSTFYTAPWLPRHPCPWRPCSPLW